MLYMSQDNTIIDTTRLKLPKSAKQNLTPSGKRKPLTVLKAHSLYDTTLNLRSFQRTAQIYYKTSSSANKDVLTLRNDINNKAVKIEFNALKGGYMRLSKVIQENGSNYYLEFFVQIPRTNKQLFLKLLKLDLI